MVELLTVEQVARLRGCSERNIRTMIDQQKLKAECIQSEKNRPKYMIPVSSLDAETREKYCALRGMIGPVVIHDNPLEQYAPAERDEINRWIAIVNEWQAYRRSSGLPRAEADDRYIGHCKYQYPDMDISVTVLYRRWQAVKQDDYRALTDQRGKWIRSKSSIDDALWQTYLYYLLDESQHPLRACYRYTQMWARNHRPDLVADMPVYETFYRRLRREMPDAVLTLGRKGDKAFDDRCAPYIKRAYDDIASNDYWVADNHTFDIISQGEDGKQHRLYLTAFFDARSGIFTGCYVTQNPSSQATLVALRKGILQYGIPDNIYVDNGREFLTFDVGGLGHRAKASQKEQFSPPPIFARLGIKMVNAIVCNAKAKIIERRFRDVKDQLSRLFETYTGGNPVEKPNRLKQVLKSGKIPSDAELTQMVETLLEWHFNRQAYSGPVVADRSKPRIEVYRNHLTRKRIAKAEELTLMLMRSTRPQTVGRRGVHLDIAGQRIDYWSDELLLPLLGKKVYLRYDPDDLSEVRVYDLEDRYIMSVEAESDTILSYGADKEAVSAAIKKTRKLKQLAREYIDNSILPVADRRTALELVLQEAYRAKEQAAGQQPEQQPKILDIQRAIEQPAYKAAVGAPDIDINRMIKNARKRQGGTTDEEV